MSHIKKFSSRYSAVKKHHKKKKHFHGLKNHPFVIPVVTFLVLFFFSSVAFVLLGSQTVQPSDLRVINLSVDGERQTLPSRAKTVKELLNMLKVEINENDIVEPGLETKILEDNFSVNVYTARPVTIVDNGRKVTVLSAYRQQRTIVEKAGINLAPEDGVERAESPELTRQNIVGEKLVVDRAKEAKISLYGSNIVVKTRAKTVADLLNEKKIRTIEGDTITPSKDTLLSTNNQIFIVRAGRKVITLEEIIPSPIEYVNDATITAGTTVIREQGSVGKKVVTYEVDAKNENAKNRVVLQEFIAIAPIRQVVARGTKIILSGGKAEWLVAAGLSPNEYAAADYIISKESGWCPTKWQGEYGGCPAYHGTPSSSGVGYGLCQATPGYKMATFGADWGTNPVTQLKWCTNYARQRFGGWQQAYNFWSINHWW